MRTEYHAFVDSDYGRCGAILRQMGTRGMRTRTVFRMGADAPVYLVDHVVGHDGDVREWNYFEYHSAISSSQHSGTRDLDGVLVDGAPAPPLLNAVGGYGEHLLVMQLLVDEEDVVSYLQFDESEPGAGAETAELRRREIEATELLDGSSVDAQRVQVVVAGRSTNTHWCVDGVIVKSDWCGAQSFLVEDLDVVCEGLDGEVSARVMEFTVQSVEPAID